MIEGDIEERMAGFAPSQRTGPSDLAREIMSQQVAGPSMEPTVPEPSPLAREIMSRDNDALMSSLMGAVDVNPDEAAKASRIGSQLGVGQDIALRNMPEMEHRARMMQLRQMQLQQRDPILAEFMSDQAFARMAYDDLPNLSVIGRAFRFLRDIPTGISEGFTKAVSQAEMSQILERQRERGGYLEEYEKAALRSYQQELSELSKETGLAEAGAYLVSQQLTDWRIEDVERVVTGGVIGGGAGFVGGPLAPATVPGGILLGLQAGFATTMLERSRRMETASLYGELEPELGHDLANKIAFGAGILNASLDVGSLGLITAPLRAPLKAAFGQAVKEAVRKRTVRDSFARFGLWYAGSVAAETGTETLQEMNNVLAMELGLYLQEKPLVLSTPEGRAEVADRLAATAVETALGMVTVGLPGPAVQFYSDVRGAARAMNEHKKLENITKAVSESKLLPRNSAALESYIASTAEGSDASTVFIDAATTNDILRQSGLTDVELDAALPGVRQQIETLQEKDIPLGGSDITIPMEQFTVRIAKTPLQEQLKQHARLSAGAPSFLEAQRIRAEMAQTRAEAEQILAAKQETDATFVAEAQAIEDRIYGEVSATGVMDERSARANAQFVRDFYVTQASRMGMTPAQMQERFPYRVQGEVAPAAPFEQAARMTLADVEQSFAELGVEQRLTETATTIRPGIIRVPAELRDEGRATRAMQSLIAYAEQSGKRIDVSPTGEFGASKKRLIAWYKRLGFVENKGANKDFAISATMYRIPSAPVLEQAAKLDSNYTAAVERGDMATAQQLVDEAARAAGYTLQGFHGTNADFTQFNVSRTGNFGPGVYLSFDEADAREYARRVGGSKVLRVVIRATNPFRIKNALAAGDFFDRFPAESDAEAVAKAQAAGYDAVLAENDVTTPFGTNKAQISVFDPSQVKLADPVTRDEAGNIVPLSRRFDITSPKLFEQAPVGPGFYSALAKAVDAIDAKSIAPAGWKERIKGLVNKGDVKQDEVDWSGLTDWLDMQEGKVTKEAVAEFLKNNGVRVERVRLGVREEELVARQNDTRRRADAFFGLFREKYGSITINDKELFDDDLGFYLINEVIAPEQLPEDLREPARLWLQAYKREDMTAPVGLAMPKFGQYVLPGGENYREVLITLPTKDRLPIGYSVVQQEGVWKVADSSGRIVMGDSLYGTTKEYAIRNAIAYLKAGQLAPEFISSHWDQPNVLVHFRLNDRVDADGKRVLFVEEIQSDWGQAGRKKGFKGRMTVAQIQEAADPDRRRFYSGMGDMSQEEWSALSERVRQWDEQENAAKSAVPLAPFVETTDGWLNLGLKHILLEATQGNYDRVAFVNGRQSADRYDLSKQVEQISWDELTDSGRLDYGAPSATKVVTIRPIRGNLIDIPIDARGIAVATGTTGNQFDGKPLDEIVPKEIAEQIMAERSGDIRGDGLKVGGRGMLEFYDKIVPAAVNKLLKKYGGGKLGSVMLPNMREQELAEDAERMGMTQADVLDLAEPSEYAAAQPGFPVTPEMVKKLESGLPLFQAMPSGGPRGGFDPRRLTTILNKTADLSTFLHETGHFYLTALADLAAMPDAPADIRSDMDTLLSWFGVAGDTDAARLAAWNAMSIDQQRKYHDQFAYSFEIYLFEGKSPSVEMRGLFERFSAWLKRVYRSIRDDLNAIYRREFGEDLPLLTGEVRQVMDRMLASEEQIRRQEAINGMKGLFQTREEAIASGMDEAEWAAYQAMQQEATEAAVTDLNTASMRQLQWLGNARARILRDLQKKHDAKRKEVAAEVAAAIKVEPVYRAMTYLRYGRFVDTDGAEVEVEGTHRLDIEKVRAMYASLPSAEGVELIRATGMAVPANVRPDITPLGTGKYGMLGRDGLDPDVVAETFGYGSGDEMVRALLAAKPMKEAVAERTDAEMLRRYGDMNTPEALEAEVQKALHNEARARFVAVELRHIAKATQPVRVMLETAKQVAADMISDTTIRNLRPSEFVAAEARAARDAERIQRTYGVTEPAPELAQRYGTDRQQALIRAKRAQLYQNQLAAEALRVKEYVDKQVKYLRRVLRDENVKRMGAAAADQIAGLLERFEVAQVSLKRLEERRTMAKYLADLKDAGIEPDIADEITDEARRVNYKELKVSEFRDLVDAVRQIEHIGKNEQKMRLAEERAAFEEVRDNVVARIRAVGKVRGLQIEPRSPLTGIGRSVAFLRGFAAQHLKAASIARILDGGKEDGPLWNAIIRTANDASDMETRMRAEASLKLGEILKPVFALGGMGGKGMYFPAIGRSLNREARIAIALNLGNDGNRQRLLDGEGWTLEQLQPVLESLTEAEWLAVQKVWDFIDGYRPEIAAKERRLYGKEPEWVKPTPFTVRTSDGKEVALQGGYYPVKYDPVASDRVATVDAVEEAKRELKGAYTAATTRRSFVKARAKEVHDKPILYTLDAAFNGVNDVIHDLAWHEWLISTNRLLNDFKFANAVRETRGWEFLKQLRDWTKDNATGARGQQVAGEAALSWLRRNISASGLGFNVVSAAMQITGFNQSIVRIGAKYVGQGIVQFSTSPFESAKTVAEKSSFMAERGRTQFREINEIKNRVRGQTEVARRVTAGTYFLMMNMQRSVDIPTWLGAYQKALDAGKDDAKAVALADQAVRDSQGSGLVSDLSAMERGGPAMKLFTVFYSYMNTVYNMTAVQTMTARGKGKLAADYAMLLVVPVVLGYAIKSAIQPDAGDDELDPEALARKLAAEELSYLMGTMVIAREFGGAAQLLTGAEGVRMGYGGPAGLRAVGEVATQAGQLEFDRAFRRSAINTLGVFTGLPSAQINRTIDGIEALVEGEVEGPTAVLAPLTGVQR